MRNSLDTAILLILVWCILNEDFSWPSLVTGLVVAIAIILMIRLLFSNNDNVKNYRIKPYLFLWYIAALIYYIFKNALETIIHLIKGEINPTVIDIRTSVHNHWFQCLIANSITLTPGTVTIDKTDHDIRVLWLYPTTTDPVEAAKIILGPFEHILKKGDYRS